MPFTGGGISAEQMKYIYHFGYSSVKDSQDSLNAVDLDSFVRQDFAGYGNACLLLQVLPQLRVSASCPFSDTFFDRIWGSSCKTIRALF